MMKKYRFLIARRITQISIMILYVIANIYGINILTGNLSSSLLLNTVPLSDPYAVIQMAFAGAILSFDILLTEVFNLISFDLYDCRRSCFLFLDLPCKYDYRFSKLFKKKTRI